MNILIYILFKRKPIKWYEPVIFALGLQTKSSKTWKIQNEKKRTFTWTKGGWKRPGQEAPLAPILSHLVFKIDPSSFVNAVIPYLVAKLFEVLKRSKSQRELWECKTLCALDNQRHWCRKDILHGINAISLAFLTSFTVQRNRSREIGWKLSPFNVGKEWNRHRKP